MQFFRIDTASTPGRFVSGIAIDPNDPNHAWISYSGYDAYTPATPDTCSTCSMTRRPIKATFTDISYNLGDQPVTGIAQDEVSGAIFASTDFGVAELAPGSTQWNAAGTGLPTSSVFGLTLSHIGRILYAATHGRGVWAGAAARPAKPGGPTAAHPRPGHARARLRRRRSRATGSTPNGGSVTFTWALPGTRPQPRARRSASPRPARGADHRAHGHRLDRRELHRHPGGHGQGHQEADDQAEEDQGRRASGKKTMVRGTITDAGGIKPARLWLGDGSKTVKLHLGRQRRLHRPSPLQESEAYTIKVKATDRVGTADQEGEGEGPKAEVVSLLTINGIASGLRNTG